MSIEKKKKEKKVKEDSPEIFLCLRQHEQFSASMHHRCLLAYFIITPPKMIIDFDSTQLISYQEKMLTFCHTMMMMIDP